MRNFKTKLSLALNVLLIVTLLGCSSTTTKKDYNNSEILIYSALTFTSFIALGICVGFKACMTLEYTGNNPELFTEAVHSLLRVRGYHSHGSAITTIIEKDKYGRIIFSYYDNENTINWLIAQKSDSTYVYYYPDFNFISMEREYGQAAPFSEQEILELKDKNDWNKPLDESKFIKQKIVRIKANRDKKLKDEYKLDNKKIFRGAGVTYDDCNYEYLTSDEHGRKLFACGHRVVITNADGSCDDSAICFMTLTDLYNYQHELREFKERNKWNVKP